MRSFLWVALALPLYVQAQPLPIFDAHVHYSHDAWDVVPVQEAIAIMRKAGVKRALISSSGDDGQQRLFAAAPDLVIPELRVYRTRGEIGTWFRDETLIPYLEDRLSKYRYVGIGEFHLYGADADLPVPRRMVQLAKKYNLFLHAHSDVDAVERLAEMLRKHKSLWADLAFRTDQASGGKVDPAWRATFLQFPDRFMVGTDTFTPERWHYIPEHAEWSRRWLADLPRDVAERIAWKNGEQVFGSLLQRPD
jgi:hypothetical protein